MSYMSDQAGVLARALEKLITLNRHQLAGHAANADFWADEARHVLSVIDTYYSRFRRMCDAQKQYVGQHRTVEFDTDRQGRKLEFDDVSAAPLTPKPIPDEDLHESKTVVAESIRRFLLRCYRDGFLDRARIRELFDRIGIGLEPSELG